MSPKRKSQSARHQWLLAGGLAALTLIVYSRTIRCGYIWDDNFHVTENPTLRDLNGLRRIWTDVTATPQYYPLVHTGFWLEYHLWALNPIGYHAVNITLHAIAAVLLWRVLLTLRLPGAWLAAAIFAVHPVTVESVAWVSERKNVQAAIFYFAAALTYLYFADVPAGYRTARRWGLYFAAVLLFLCALLSKTVTCSLPVALLLATWWRAGTLKRGDLLRLVPFGVMGAVLGLLTAWIEKHHVGAEGTTWSLTFPERVLIASRAVWFYATKLVWPYKLTFIYPRWQFSISSASQWLFLLALLVVLAALWLGRRSIGRGPLTAVLIFMVTLFPALGFFDVYPFRYSFVADHFQYLAAPALIALAAAGLNRLPRLAPLAVLVALAALSWRQIGVYRDSETLWRDTITKNPNCWMALDSFAAILLQKGQPEQALSTLRHAETLDPKNAETQANIGRAFSQMGSLEEALPYYEKAVELRPDFPAMNYDLGHALLQRGRFEAAIHYLQQTIALDSTYLPAYNDLGYALLRTGRAEESLIPLQAALRIDQNDSSAHFNIANTLLQLHHIEEAVAHLRSVLAANPRDPEALKNLAWILATSPDPAQRNGSKAVELAESATALNARPDPVIGATLAAAYAEVGRFSEAITTAEGALQLATENGDPALAQLIRTEIELYQLSIPFRDNR